MMLSKLWSAASATDWSLPGHLSKLGRLAGLRTPAFVVRQHSIILNESYQTKRVEKKLHPLDLVQDI